MKGSVAKASPADVKQRKNTRNQHVAKRTARDHAVAAPTLCCVSKCSGETSTRPSQTWTAGGGRIGIAAASSEAGDEKFRGPRRPQCTGVSMSARSPLPSWSVPRKAGTRSRNGSDKVKERQGQGQGKAGTRSRKGRDKVKERQGQDQGKAGLRSI